MPLASKSLRALRESQPTHPSVRWGTSRALVQQFSFIDQCRIEEIHFSWKPIHLLHPISSMRVQQHAVSACCLFPLPRIPSVLGMQISVLSGRISCDCRVARCSAWLQ